MANRMIGKRTGANSMNANMMNTVLDQITDKIERLQVVDPLADRLAAWIAPLYANRTVVDVASGTPLGHPLHPLLVTVPIGAYSGAFLFDALKDPAAADTLIALGILSSVPAAYTGLSDWRDTKGAERRVGLVHAASNTVSLALFVASWVARRSGDRTLGVKLSLAGATFVSLGGWLGGHLIYALGVGVDTTAFQQAPEDWTYAAQESEVTEGDLTMGAVNGVPLVLTRLAGGRIVAYADRCSHRGGPLHEGQLVDDCIECPWHQSRFSVEDGAVMQGPATRPQPAYEVRVQNERVEVRRSDEVRALRTNPVGR
ncbi:MAG TPA: Rieske 2Fe-2S domain-containing protein [Propionibacteriaceae bacterium]